MDSSGGVDFFCVGVGDLVLQDLVFWPCAHWGGDSFFLHAYSVQQVDGLILVEQEYS